MPQTAAGVAAGTVPSRAGAALAQAARPAFPRIDPTLTMTPGKALEWNLFKAEGGPTYPGGVGWKRYTDFLIKRMPEFGAIGRPRQPPVSPAAGRPAFRHCRHAGASL
ncbi:MAG: hypothetical protein U1E56_00260 [Bauldia sp.]